MGISKHLGVIFPASSNDSTIGERNVSIDGAFVHKRDKNQFYIFSLFFYPYLNFRMHVKSNVR